MYRVADLSGNRLDAWTESAREYDSFEKKWHFYGTVADAMIGRLDLEQGSRVLELACGTGACTVKLAGAARNGRVVALDYSEGMLGVARENAAEAGVSNVTFVLGDAGDIASLLAEQTFDFAVCNSAFWHFPEPDRVLAGLRALLTENGVFAFSLPSWVEGRGEARESLRANVRELLLKRGVGPEQIAAMAARRGRRMRDVAGLLGRFGFEATEFPFEFRVSQESREDWRRISVFSDSRRSWSFPELDAATQKELRDEVEAWRRANLPRDALESRWLIYTARRSAELPRP